MRNVRPQFIFNTRNFHVDLRSEPVTFDLRPLTSDESIIPFQLLVFNPRDLYNINGNKTEMEAMNDTVDKQEECYSSIIQIFNINYYSLFI